MRTNYTYIMLLVSLLSTMRDSMYTYTDIADNPVVILCDTISPCDEFVEEYTEFDIYGTEFRILTVFDFEAMKDGFYPDIEGQDITITSFAIYTPEEWRQSRIMYSSKYM